MGDGANVTQVGQVVVREVAGEDIALVTAPEETTSDRSLNIRLNIPMTSEDALKRHSMSVGAYSRCSDLFPERS
jgi:hypothetical protein